MIKKQIRILDNDEIKKIHCKIFNETFQKWSPKTRYLMIEIDSSHLLGTLCSYDTRFSEYKEPLEFYYRKNKWKRASQW